MDELDEQLRQLSVINTRLSITDTNNDSSDTSHIDVAKLVSGIEEKNFSKAYKGVLKNCLIYDHHLNSSKRVGPSVPPKPLKKSPNIPEIPQSSLVKQNCEPLYAQRLQSLDSNNYDGEISKQPFLLRKQNSYDTGFIDSVLDTPTSLGLKTRRKVTLDNPAILEQQLEVLEHHKKQLEKLGKLNQNSSSNSKSIAMHLNAPKLSTSSLLTDASLNTHNVNITYANTINTNATSPSAAAGANAKSYIYGNIISSPKSVLSNIYSNVAYDKDEQEQVCGGEQNISASQIPHSKKKPVSSLNEDNNVFFTHNGSMLPEEEILPPLSPVSSSYSELRRATDVFKTNNLPQKATIVTANNHINIAKPFVGYEMPHDHKLSVESTDMRQLYVNKAPYTANDVFNSYNSGIQTSSTYESIYEPINPRPPSQLSAHSQNLIYPTCIKTSNTSSFPESGDVLAKSNSSNLSTLSSLSADSNLPVYPNRSRGSEDGGTLNRYPQNPKELGVESLTDFLGKSLDPQQDLENYGICFKCNEIVVGENSGCTAMDQIYHIACFTCSQCQINLQGKPFYALDCKPYCEFDYLQTLEKCSVCMKPILERILRATGKPYHPQCFTCVVCKKSLDGIPFTVDATNQNYCIEDFHKKFAPRCCVCKEPIMPEAGEEETVRVVALDRSFHFECYKCEDCDLLLSSEAEGRGCYPLDDHVLCKSCNAKRVQMLTNRMTTTEL